MTTHVPPAGYVPGAPDADGNEDPLPTEVLETIDVIASKEDGLKECNNPPKE